MNLKQLEAFARVAEAKSFSEAAKILYLTQPTVSAHVASLEKELGVCLLMRSTKEVSLTEEGEILYDYAMQMLELEQQIRERFGSRKKEGAVLRIAASTIPSQYLLPEIMVRFRERYPGVRLRVMETDSAGAVEQILSRRADIGFAGTVLEEKQCIYIPFYQDELVVIIPGEGLEGPESAAETAAWIRRMPVILREEGSGTRKEAQRLLRQMGIELSELNIVASIQNQETIKRSVRNGMGISILSRLAAEDEIRSGVLRAVPLGETGGKRNINLVFDRRSLHSTEAEKLIDLVKEMYPDNV
ncbi:MAG TPA: LysR family transcriptional regulator [Candidatus Mediterraneibacter caccogallinarum]|nr:LysR family transcriptional regulator [Candidatus Mediterraneibacter caccogallinarum]